MNKKEKKQYELILRNKFIAADAKSFKGIITALEERVALLKELQATRKVKYVGGSDDDYATFITTDAEIAEKYDFVDLG